jgi:hypothetical protein
MCHTPETWIVKNIKLVHQQSRFPLVGVHQSIDCRQCHKQYDNLNFQPIGASCYSCHSIDYLNAKNPNHLTSGFSTDCESCHSITSRLWIAQNFQHDFFPLTGGHKIDNCFSCHKSGTFAGLSKVCVSCHLTKYNNTTNPPHVTTGFGTDCQTCHSTTAWQPASFAIHNNYFPLLGAHATTATCQSCHNGNYNNIPNQCVGCHLDSYNNSLNPKHSPAGISTACQTCHNSTAWIPSLFNHAATGFALAGVHATIQCSSCHIGTTSGLNSLCVTCHLLNYNSAANHLSQNYPTTCELCHNTSDWSQSTFNHQTTPFPLTGAHTTVTCNNCHQNGFTIPTTCASCHQINYNTTTNPNHITLALATTCETCHTTNLGWQPASFPVHNNYYVLAGAHTSLTCLQCHNGNYGPTSVPTDCYSCHTANYNNTTNPNHAAAQFPHECQTCHSQTVWSPSTFNHDQLYFPIYSGSHLNRWTLCSQCHQDPSNFLTFTCMSSGCHSQSSTDQNHSGVSGYSYVASACYNCHPNGRSNKSILRPPTRRIN